MKEKLLSIRDYLVKHSIIAYPVIIIAAVALTVAIALKAGNNRAGQQLPVPSQEVSMDSSQPVVENGDVEIGLQENMIPEIYTLIATYYNAYATGDVETIRNISNYMDDTDVFKIPEMAKYIETYPLIQIFTKPGPIKDTYLAYVYFHLTVKGYDGQEMPGMEIFYVGTREDGSYFLNTDKLSDEEMEYIQKLSTQEDVTELKNRVDVECSEFFLEHADMYTYVQEFVNEVQKATGEALAAQIGNEGTATTPDDGTQGGENPDPVPDDPGESVPQKATATTTVNVRSSDSQQAEKLGKLTQGQVVEVVEQKVNGWTHIKFEGKDGYVKTEFLQMAEEVPASQVIGQVTATTNINVRALPDETSNKLGVLTGGDTADLLSVENGWCKIRYNGQAAYVKEEYVQQ